MDTENLKMKKLKNTYKNTKRAELSFLILNTDIKNKCNQTQRRTFPYVKKGMNPHKKI